MRRFALHSNLGVCVCVSHCKSKIFDAPPTATRSGHACGYEMSALDTLTSFLELVEEIYVCDF